MGGDSHSHCPLLQLGLTLLPPALDQYAFSYCQSSTTIYIGGLGIDSRLMTGLVMGSI